MPNTPATVFNIAALSKQLVGVTLAMLADEGRLAPDDDVRRHLPALPDFGPTVTLRHLLVGRRRPAGACATAARR